MLKIPPEATNSFKDFMAKPVGEVLTTYVPGGGYSAWGGALIEASILKTDTELSLNGQVRRVRVEAEDTLIDQSVAIYRIRLILSH